MLRRIQITCIGLRKRRSSSLPASARNSGRLTLMKGYAMDTADRYMLCLLLENQIAIMQELAHSTSLPTSSMVRMKEQARISAYARERYRDLYQLKS